jgi:hypothetical protein
MVGTFIFLLPFYIAGNKKALPAEMTRQAACENAVIVWRRTASVHGLFLPVDEYEKQSWIRRIRTQTRNYIH